MSIVADIQTRIEAGDGNTALHQVEQFRERADLLDAMELQVVDALDALAATYPHDAHISALHARALELQHTLVSKNKQFCDQLRAQIAAGKYDHGALLQTFIRNSAPHPNDDLLYDSLDMLVNGILQTGSPPEAGATLEREMVGYQPTPARLIVELVQRAQLDHADVFYDLGSGLGHVALVAALLSGARTVGVEIDASYHACARRCAALLHLHQVEFRNEDARTADFSDGTLFYLYTPFQGTLLQTVLDRLHHEAKQRSIRICTYGPCTTTVAQQSWLIPDHDPIRCNTLAFFHSTT